MFIQRYCEVSVKLVTFKNYKNKTNFKLLTKLFKRKLLLVVISKIVI